MEVKTRADMKNEAKGDVKETKKKIDLANTQIKEYEKQIEQEQEEEADRVMQHNTKIMDLQKKIDAIKGVEITAKAAELTGLKAPAALVGCHDGWPA